MFVLRTASRTRADAAPPIVAPAPPVEPQWPVGLGILKLGETEFLVDHRVIDVVLEEQAAIMRRPRHARRGAGDVRPSAEL
jgi:hypothetical protein